MIFPVIFRSRTFVGEANRGPQVGMIIHIFFFTRKGGATAFLARFGAGLGLGFWVLGLGWIYARASVPLGSAS